MVLEERVLTMELAMAMMARCCVSLRSARRLQMAYPKLTNVYWSLFLKKFHFVLLLNLAALQ